MIHFLISSLLLSLLAFLPMTAAEKEEEFMHNMSNYSNSLIADKALLQATWDNNRDEVEKQLNNGADPNTRYSEYAQTPLMIACVNNNLLIVQKLLERKADPNKGNISYITPLHYLIRPVYTPKQKNILIDILQTLINAKADLDTQDKHGKTALMNSCRNTDLDNIKLLLELNASMDLKDHNNRTAYNNAQSMYHHYTCCEDTERIAILKEIIALLEAEPDRRIQLKLKAQSNSLYQSTFALAYRKRLYGFLGNCLPHDIVDIEIAQHIAAPPYALPEIETGLNATAEHTK